MLHDTRRQTGRQAGYSSPEGALTACCLLWLLLLLLLSVPHCCCWCLLVPNKQPDVSAPSCTKAPTSLNSVADSSGRLWGWEKGVSCVFRAAAVGPSQPVSYAATTWQAAPTCWGVPTPQTSVLDDLGRLW